MVAATRPLVGMRIAILQQEERRIMTISRVTVSPVGWGLIHTRTNRRRLPLLYGLLAVSSLCAFSLSSQGGLVAHNSIALSETYADKVRCINYGGGDIECDVPNTGSYNVVAVVSLAGVNINKFNGTTPFELIVGNVDLSNILSDDPKYATNKTSATFAYLTNYTDNNGNDHTIHWGTVKLKWNRKTLTVNVNFKNDSDWDDVQYLWADQYDFDPSGPITDTTYGEVDFANTVSSIFSNVSVTGKITTKDVIAKDGTTNTVSTIKVLGAATN